MLPLLLLFLLPWVFILFKKMWDKLDESTKKLIIEKFIEFFEEILRDYYKWWKQQKEEEDK